MPKTAHKLVLVYGITKGDGSSYNRTVQIPSTKSKVGGAITNGEYNSQETKASKQASSGIDIIVVYSGDEGPTDEELEKAKAEYKKRFRDTGKIETYTCRGGIITAEAARRVGYSPKSARFIASRLWEKPIIRDIFRRIHDRINATRKISKGVWLIPDYSGEYHIYRKD